MHHLVPLLTVLALGVQTAAEEPRAGETPEQEIERELHEITPSTPPTLQLSVEAAESERYVLDDARFTVDGKPVASALKPGVLPKKSQRVFTGPLTPGSHVITAYLNLKGVTHASLFSYEDGYRFKIGGSTRLIAENGLILDVHFRVETHEENPDLTQRVALVTDVIPRMSANLAVASEEPLPSPAPAPVAPSMISAKLVDTDPGEPAGLRPSPGPSLPAARATPVPALPEPPTAVPTRPVKAVASTVPVPAQRPSFVIPAQGGPVPAQPAPVARPPSGTSALASNVPHKPKHKRTMVIDPLARLRRRLKIQVADSPPADSSAEDTPAVSHSALQNALLRARAADAASADTGEDSPAISHSALKNALRALRKKGKTHTR